MKQLDVRNLPEAEIMEMMLTLAPGAKAAIENSAHIRGQLRPYQAAALYWMASEYNLDGSRIVEIGTLHGYSASITAYAARRAHITTLNPNMQEVGIARKNLAKCTRVAVVNMASWDYYPAAPNNLDMVFVDGDHKRAVRDLPWWNLLAQGGAMVFHDYSKKCGPYVIGAVTKLCAQVQKDGPDVVIIDNKGVGMAAVYKDSYIGWPGVR